MKPEQFKYAGKNAKVFPTAIIIEPQNIEIGDESLIDDFCFVCGVRDGIKIGRFCHITTHSTVWSGGRIEFKDFSAVGPGCIVLASTDAYDGSGFIGLKVLTKYRNTLYAPITLEKHAHVGMGSIIQPGITIGEGCSIGSGSVVTKDMPPWTICWGNPCRPMKDKPKEKQLEMEKRFLEEYYGHQSPHST